MKNILKTVGIILMVLIFIFIGIKSFVYYGFTTSDTIETYETTGGSHMLFIFLPDNDAIIYFNDVVNNKEEYVLAHITGEHGTHYFKNIWSVNSSVKSVPSIFNFRIYPKNVRPVSLEIKIEKKYINGSGDIVFPKIGDTTNKNMLFTDESIKFNGMWMNKIDTDQNFVNLLLEKLN